MRTPSLAGSEEKTVDTTTTGSYREKTMTILRVQTSHRLDSQWVHGVMMNPAWKSATSPSGGTIGDVVVGDSVTDDTVECDVFVHELDPGQQLRVDLSTFTPYPYKDPVFLPPEAKLDPVGYFGVPKILGVPFTFMSLRENGAHLLVHFRLRGNPLCFDLYLRVYPLDEKRSYKGTLSVTNSHPMRSEVTYVAPVDINIEDGDPFADPLLRAGESIGDGQTIRVPVICTRGVLRVDREWELALGVDGVGTLPVCPTGNWNEDRWTVSISALYPLMQDKWQPSSIGVAARSGDSGDQEEQGYYSGFEVFQPGASLRPLYLRKLAAYKQGLRPCHHLDIAGNIIDPEMQQPRLVYWYGRPHWNTNVSPNQLGKSRGLTEADAHGWLGPNNEHFLLNGVCSTRELTGDPALLDEIRHHAMLFLGSETTDPSIATTRIAVSRAAGWTLLSMANAYRLLLMDEPLRMRIRQRAAERCAYWMQQWLPNKLWDVRPNTVGNYLSVAWAPFYCMTYQQAVGMFGMWYAGKVMEMPSVVSYAQESAKTWLAAS